MISIKRNRCKQLLNAAACLLLLLSFSCLHLHAEDSGECGENVTWEFSNGQLTISGTGQMNDYLDGDYAPWYDFNSDIRLVVISEGVTTIGKLAFYECTNLKEVIIAESVTHIGDFAFLECENLKSVELGHSIIRIGKAAFKMCTSLSSFDFYDGIQAIDSEAFFGCKSLISIILPPSIIKLGEAVFTYCDQLRSASINASIAVLPEWTFYGCEKLQIVSFSNSIESVGNLSFYDCNELDKVYTSSEDDTAKLLTNQIKQDISHFESVQSTDKKANDESVSSTVVDNNKTVIEEIEEDNFSFQGTMNKDGDSYQVVIDSTISNETMWDTIVEKSDTYIQLNDKKDDNSSIKVNLTVKNNLSVDKNVLKKYAGKNVVLHIELNGLNAEIQCDKLDEKARYSDLTLNYSLEKINKYDDSMIEVLGNADAFSLMFEGSASYPMTIRIPIGQEYAYGYATLFQKDGKHWKLIHSVRIDSKGNASLYLSSFDSMTKYMIGLNLEGINITNAYIPSELSDDYGMLTDEHGNMYEVTGINSKWGITLSQFSLIVFGVLGGVFLLVGMVMFVIFKMQQNKEKIRRQVMMEKSKKM